MQYPTLGVIIVAFNSEDVIVDCLESLLASEGVALDIQVINNASTDRTVATLQDWATGTRPIQLADDLPFALKVSEKPLKLDGSALHSGHRITLTETGVNGGFAFGVNAGLAALAPKPQVDRFWILNPDSVVPPKTAFALATCPAPPEGFSLMGGRVLYYETPDIIQIDGGLLNRQTGVTGNSGLGQKHDDTPPPDPAGLDFVTGASMVASRQFYDAVGPMAEDYFLYYEEVDWALSRGHLPLIYCPDAIVYHKAGTAIGSPTLGRPASAFSQYFKHRSRLMFARRWLKGRVGTAVLYSLAKAAQLALKGYFGEAQALLAGTFNRPPPENVRTRLSEDARQRAFSSRH